MPLYLVDTLVTYRMKYVIEAKELSHAYDEIVMTEHNRDFDELTQRCLGEQIIDGREITRDDFRLMLQQLAESKEEMSSYWMGDKCIKTVNYENPTG